MSPASARVIGATSKPSAQLRTPTTRDPFRKLKDALDSATSRSSRPGESPSDPGREAGLLGREDAAAVGTSGREAADSSARSEAGTFAPETEAEATQGGERATQNVATPADRSVLRMAGIALVIAGLVIGLLAYSRRGTRT